MYTETRVYGHISPPRYSHWSYTSILPLIQLQSKFLGAPEKKVHTPFGKQTVTLLRSLHYREKTKAGMFSWFHDLKWQADNRCWVTPKLFTVSPTQTRQNESGGAYKMADLPLSCVCVCVVVEISHMKQMASSFLGNRVIHWVDTSKVEEENRSRLEL